MSRQRRRIEELTQHIRRYHQLELAEEPKSFKRFYYWALRWGTMLYYESIKDDVKIRAESLAFLMMFSILPLIAGVFFVFTVFTQFGMVQEAIGGFVNNFLETIPAEHRELVQEYIVKFKDAYLATISGRSGTLGIFALAILIWIGLQTFNNIDRTINHIWHSDQERPFLEKARNFLVVSIAAPLVLIASLSVPLVLSKIAVTKILFETVRFLPSLLNVVIPVAFILGTFTCLYRYVPVRKVQWRSALIGGTFAAVLLHLANVFMNLYFRFGTNTAYGKAAILPLLGFWIYLVWVIVIVGAELSYLAQNEKYIVKSLDTPPSFYEGECLLAIIVLLYRNHLGGKGSLSLSQIFNHTHLDVFSIKRILTYLEDQKITVQSVPLKSSLEPEFFLAKDISKMNIAGVLREYLVKDRAHVADESIAGPFKESLNQWLAYFGERTFADI